MSSFRRIISSRANGALSRGPKTTEGKRKSSQNAVRHGLLSKTVIAQNESNPVFDMVLADHFNALKPANDAELALTKEMVESSYRLRRLWTLENKMMIEAMQTVDSPDELTRLANAFSQLAESPGYLVLDRYAVTLDRTYYRALRDILLLRKLRKQKLPKEPTL